MFRFSAIAVALLAIQSSVMGGGEQRRRAVNNMDAQTTDYNPNTPTGAPSIPEDPWRIPGLSLSCDFLFWTVDGRFIPGLYDVGGLTSFGLATAWYSCSGDGPGSPLELDTHAIDLSTQTQIRSSDEQIHLQSTDPPSALSSCRATPCSIPLAGLNSVTAQEELSFSTFHIPFHPFPVPGESPHGGAPPPSPPNLRFDHWWATSGAVPGGPRLVITSHEASVLAIAFYVRNFKPRPPSGPPPGYHPVWPLCLMIDCGPWNLRPEDPYEIRFENASGLDIELVAEQSNWSRKARSVKPGVLEIGFTGEEIVKAGGLSALGLQFRGNPESWRGVQISVRQSPKARSGDK